MDQKRNGTSGAGARNAREQSSRVREWMRSTLYACVGESKSARDSGACLPAMDNQGHERFADVIGAALVLIYL
jgi:hypothetical protein